MDRLSLLYVVYTVICCGAILTGQSAAECQAGYCSLGDSATSAQYCMIRGDTRCDVNTHCHGYGECFFDKDALEPYCNCSETRYGDECQNEYDFKANRSCSEDADCRVTNGTGMCEYQFDDNQVVQRCASLCAVGYRGNHCELPARVMDPNIWTMCYNGGTPTKQGEKEWCTCPCGFTGVFCDSIAESVQLDPNCNRVMCNDHGQCIDPLLYSSNYIVCSCDSGYTGRFCEEALPTTPKPITTTAPFCVSDRRSGKQCLNGGTCVNSIQCTPGVPCGVGGEGDTCECMCGYFGDHCEFSTYPTDDNYGEKCLWEWYPCYNGGTCHVSENHCYLKCDCAFGFKGYHCDIACDRLYDGCGLENCGSICVEDSCGKPRCEDNPYNAEEGVPTPILYILLGFVLPVLLIILALISVMRKRKRRKRLAATAALAAFVQQTRNINSGLAPQPTASLPISRTPWTAIHLNNSQGSDAPPHPTAPPYTTNVGVAQDQPVHVTGNGQVTAPAVLDANPPTYAEACEDPPKYSEVG